MLSEAFQGPNNATFGGGIFTNVFQIVTNTWVVVALRDDLTIEGDEALNLTLSQPNGKDVLFLGGENIPLGVALGPSSARLTLIDNDFQNGVLGFASSTFTVNENAGVATITVLRTNGTVGSVSVDYATTNGTALAGFDYVATRGTLTFGGGVTSRTFTVPIVDDTTAESDETILLGLSNPVGGALLNATVLPSTATLVIYDNDFAAGKLSFVADTATVSESAGSVSFSVIRTGGSVGTITVDYFTTNDTALAGADYVATSGTLGWASGDTAPKTITVPIINDSVPEGPEVFNLVLTNPRVVATGLPGMLGLTTNVKVTITDDDFAGVVEFTSAIYNANENGGSTVLTVRRTGGVSGQALVDYTVTGGTASPGTHFNLANGTLVIEDGQFSGNFAVQLIDNSTADGNKTVIIDLSNPQGATLGNNVQATLTIIDDESFNVPAGSLDTAFNAAAGGDNFVYASVLQPDQRSSSAGISGISTGSRATASRASTRMAIWIPRSIRRAGSTVPCGRCGCSPMARCSWPGCSRWSMAPTGRGWRGSIRMVRSTRRSMLAAARTIRPTPSRCRPTAACWSVACSRPLVARRGTSSRGWAPTA